LFRGFGLEEVRGVLTHSIVREIWIIRRGYVRRSGRPLGGDIALQQASKPLLRAVVIVLNAGGRDVCFQRPVVFGPGGNRTLFLGMIIRRIAHGS
jgi:hypothetical protein